MAGGEDYHEVSTMSKRDYYTLKDKGALTTAAEAQKFQMELEQKQKNMREAANQPLGRGQKKYNVILLDGDTAPFIVDAKTTASQLLDHVCEFLGLHEKEYFGLSYCNSSQTYFWLNDDKRIDQQLKKASDNLELLVKFYPPNPENLRGRMTRYLLTLQLRQNMIAGQLPCSFVTYIILGSYVVQSELGDFDDLTSGDLSYVESSPFCPKEVSQPELLEKVSELHRCHRGMEPEEADMEFLTNARKLAMYGVHPHSARDTSGEEIVVGVYYGGVIVYKNSLRVGRFSWPRILRVNTKDSTVKLEIRTGGDDPKGKDAGQWAKTNVDFKCKDKKLAKRLWRNIVEHHGFFRLTTPEKPTKPLIPGTFNRKWNYTGPTAQQASAQPITDQPEFAITRGMRRSFKKKNDGLSRELPPQQMQHERQLPNLGQFGPDRWAMSPSDCDQLLAPALNPASGSCHWPSGDTEWRGVRANKAVSESGKWYYETTLDGGGDSQGCVPARVGFSTAEGSLQLGSDANGWGFGAGPNGEQGCKLNSAQPELYGRELRLGDVVGAFVDLDEGVVEFSVNGERLGPAFQLDEQQQQQALYPAACSRDGTSLAWNFGDDPDRPLVYPPSGPWRPVGAAPVPTSNPRAWRLNPRDTTGPDLLLSPDRAVAQAKGGWQGVRSDRGLQGGQGGKYYYEVDPLEEAGLGRVGWSTEDASLMLGQDNGGWGYGADPEGFGLNGTQGKRLHGNEIDNYGEPFDHGDTIGCMLDLDNGVMQFSRNGRHFGPAYQLPRDRLQPNSGALFPTVCMRDQTLDVNLGQRPFKYQPSPDWLPVCMATGDQVQLSKTAAQGMNVPSVDQKYDTIHSNKPTIQVAPRPQRTDENGMLPGITVRESRNETEEYGEPEETIETFTDEHGNVVTRRVKKQTRMRQVEINRIYESRGGYDDSGPNTEQLDRAMNGNNERATTARKNVALSERDEGDDLLDDIIFAQTGFNRSDTIADEVVNDFNMSTLDNRKQLHESEI